ncbi:MAG: hypothetical protein GX046_08355 [Tissierellia bacterium]|nr:hypothetical protein [Tissierellia bacterium]
MQSQFLRSLFVVLLVLVPLFFLLFFLERLGFISGASARTYFIIALILGSIDLFLSSKIQKWIQDLKSKEQD